MAVGMDGQPQGPIRYTEQRGSEYSRGEGGGDADGRALVVARPVASSIHLSLYLSGIGHKGPILTTHPPLSLLYTGLASRFAYSIVGASGERMWGGGPLWSPVRC